MLTSVCNSNTYITQALKCNYCEVPCRLTVHIPALVKQKLPCVASLEVEIDFSFA
jgi:hypothetical protein